MKNKKWIIIFIVVLIVSLSVYFIFFNNKMAKSLKIGNNSSSQEIVNYILNISSYEATIDVEVQSNKNTNKYKIKQQCILDDVSIQEILEPSNIAGVRVIRNGNNLKLENTKLDLNNIFENYQYISENALDLSSFIQDYKSNCNSKYEEKNEEIKMQITNNNLNKVLFISKKDGLPIKMEVKDLNRKTTIYILYNEVNVNSLKKENIVAFEFIDKIKGV